MQVSGMKKRTLAGLLLMIGLGLFASSCGPQSVSTKPTTATVKEETPPLDLENAIISGDAQVVIDGPSTQYTLSGPVKYEISFYFESKPHLELYILLN